MYTHIMSMYKKITAVIVLFLFSFILLAPTANALGYDPKKRQMVIIPDGDADPWGELDVYDPPPDDQKDDISIKLFVLSGKLYIYNFFRINIENVINYKEIDNRFNNNKPKNSQLR